MSAIRCLQFITPAGFYGAERWVLALANNIDPESMINDLAVTNEGEGQDLTVAELYPNTTGEVHYLPMSGRFDVRVVTQLVKVIKRRQIDIVHTHGYKSDILGLMAARIAGIKCVSTPHGFSGKVGFKLGAFIRLGTFMLRYFDAVAPLSEELSEDMARFNVPKAKTHFIRNGVDLKEIDQAMRDLSLNSALKENDHRTIGFIGQLIPRKGIPDLLEAFDQLYQQNPDLKLQLLGDGRQRAELEAQAAAQQSAPGIEFLGFRGDRLELLSRFDLFVMTSSLEGIPRCMMEAMAVGVPVVAYDIPGVDQLVEHGKTGLLAPHGDKVALVACCQQVLDNSELAEALTRNARQMIDERYSAARMAREYEALFAELTGQSVPSAPGHRKAG
ncbi:glycosyltransferase family 4 protein [uncultured Marinobacter sp.]|uniref:glycosyltransferase family 4 protein n=1 Tax=uncultured Marinobacter sp. TaxID=187379 RepID=UPI0030D92772